jgi:Xaa-Pro aminopeptidase
VLAAEEAAIQQCLPGKNFDDIHNKALDILVHGLIDLNLLEGSVEQILEDKSYRAYFMHRTSHWLGLDVHDTGHYFESDATSRILKPGMVLTVEPGLYFHPEFCTHPKAQDFLGIGIRIEDNVLITEHGCEILTSDAPKTIPDIEAIVGTDQLPQ